MHSLTRMQHARACTLASRQAHGSSLAAPVNTAMQCCLSIAWTRDVDLSVNFSASPFRGEAAFLMPFLPAVAFLILSASASNCSSKCCLQPGQNAALQERTAIHVENEVLQTQEKSVKTSSHDVSLVCPLHRR
jgi:hypothetical protein